MTTVDGGGQQAVPVTGNAWTQAAGEVDQLPLAGTITYTPPVSPGCGTPGAFGVINVTIEVNGTTFKTEFVTTLLDGVQHSQQFGTVGSLPEPGAATLRTITVKVSDPCPAPGDNFQIHSIGFDAVSAR